MPLVLIYGLGAFGYAILKHLDRPPRFYKIAAYDRDKKLMQSLRHHGRHTFFQTSQPVSKKVVLLSDPAQVFPKVEVLILAVTAKAIPEVIKKLNRLPRTKKKLLIINVAKALDATTGQRLELIIKKHFHHPFQYVYFAGGTIAHDLYNFYPLGATLASRSPKALALAEEILSAPNLRLYKTNDVSGVEYCGAFKNIISIFAGIVSGLGWPYGSETFFISRFSHEIERFVVKELKGQVKTFSMNSQCWGNDLWMSCTGKTRNREFGYLIGQGKTVKQALAIMTKKHKSIEGIVTISILKKLCSDFSSYPFLLAMQDIIINNKKPAKIIKNLVETHTI